MQIFLANHFMKIFKGDKTRNIQKAMLRLSTIYNVSLNDPADHFWWFDLSDFLDCACERGNG